MSSTVTDTFVARHQQFHPASCPLANGHEASFGGALAASRGVDHNHSLDQAGEAYDRGGGKDAVDEALERLNRMDLDREYGHELEVCWGPAQPVRSDARQLRAEWRRRRGGEGDHVITGDPTCSSPPPLPRRYRRDWT